MSLNDHYHPEGVTSQSVYSLVLANAWTLLLAWLFRWPLATLLWPYWIQSVIIGYYSRRRMLALERFSTAGLTSNDQPVPETPEGLRSTANFFVLHYGFFHAIYLIFLSTGAVAGGAPLTPADWASIAAAAAAFAVNHRLSFLQNMSADRRGRPNLGVLLFLPYARIVPMHLAIILGGWSGNHGNLQLLIFGGLKTGADVLMHWVEHKVLQGGAPQERPRP